VIRRGGEWVAGRSGSGPVRGKNLAGAAPILLLLAVSEALPAVGPQEGPAPEEEFLGPFPGWADLKRDYGAAGDGKTDDTAAWQKALDDLRGERRARSVLYVPAGTYRITQTLRMPRERHNEGLGSGIWGEDPEKTVLRWDGAPDGVMLLYNPWYARLGRLTFDGAGRAKTAIQFGTAFVTANEISDLLVRDVAFGIEAGQRDGIAETTVIRCRFQRCSKAAISIQNWNSLDWFVWHSLFEDCAIGVTNQFLAGNFHVYESVFRNSGVADVTIGNTMYFSLRRNWSIGSKAFFVAGGIGAGCPTTIEGNTILGCREVPIQVGNLGPLVLLDNRIASEKGGTLVRLAGHTAALSVGNTFAVAAGRPVAAGARYLSIDDRLGPLPPAKPPAFAFAPRGRGPVIEVRPGAGAPELQEAILKAASLRGRRPVLHLPAGDYRLGRTVYIPPGCDVQIAGDGKQNATSLGWSGSGAGPVFWIAGNSRATLRDLSVQAGKQADAIVVGGDPPEGRAVLRQVWAGGSDVCFLFDRLARSNVFLQDCGHAGSRIGMKAVGAGADGKGNGPRKAGLAVLYSGATSNNEYSYEVERGGWLLARDVWYESGSHTKFMRCADGGTFVLHNAQVAHPRGEEPPPILVENFRGRLCFVGTNFSAVGRGADRPHVVVRGEGRETRLLLLGTHGHGEYLKVEAPAARAARLLAIQYEGAGAKPIADAGAADPAFLLDLLAPTRNVRIPFSDPLPPGAGDVRFYRMCVGGRHAVTFTAAPAPDGAGPR